MLSFAPLLVALALASSCHARTLAPDRALLQANLTIPIAPNTTGVEIGGFTFGSEVGAYTLMPKDICDMSAALSASPPDFATAMDIYEQGKNSPRGTTALRTLKSFATGTVYGTPLAFRLQYVEYLNELYFMDAAVEEALSLTPTTTSAQVLKQIPQGLILGNYVMHEVEAGLNKTVSGAANNTDLAKGAPHNIDEAWGLYAGTGASCGSMMALVQDMSKAFGARRDSTDGTKCESLTHNAVLAAFTKMYAAAVAGDVSSFTQGRDTLAKLVLVPYLQGTIKAAAEVSRRVGLKQNAASAMAQGYGTWSAIEPVAAGIDQAAADTIAEAFFLEDAPAVNTGAKVAAAVQTLVTKAGISPTVVGTLGQKQYLKCDGSKQALDKCLAKCPTAAKTVCGYNGKTYRTKCAAVCIGTTVRKTGKC